MNQQMTQKPEEEFNLVRFDSLAAMRSHWRQALGRRVFWQDEAEWYIICNSCYFVQRGEQWTGSTRVSDWDAQRTRIHELAESTAMKRCAFCKNPLFPFVEIEIRYFSDWRAELSPLITQFLKRGYQIFLEEIFVSLELDKYTPEDLNPIWEGEEVFFEIWWHQKVTLDVKTHINENKELWNHEFRWDDPPAPDAWTPFYRWFPLIHIPFLW